MFRPHQFVKIRMIRGLSHNVDSRHASVFIRPECDAETHSDLHFYPLIICVLSDFRVRLNGIRMVFLGFALFSTSRFEVFFFIILAVISKITMQRYEVYFWHCHHLSLFVTFCHLLF